MKNYLVAFDQIHILAIEFIKQAIH